MLKRRTSNSFGLLIFIFVSSFFIIFLGLAKPVRAAVRFNEVAWMGTETSAADEWIELYNDSYQAVDLDGWLLAAADGAPQMNLAGQIPAQGYFLLERTDDNTVPNIAANQIYTGALANGGEDLFLKNAQGQIIDEIKAAAGGWPGGDNSTKQTMVRCGQSWQTSRQKGGSPAAANDCGQTNAPVCGNQIIENGEECDDGNNIGGDGCDSQCQLEETSSSGNGSSQTAGGQNNAYGQATSSKSYQPPQPVYTLGDVVINELVSDPADGETEWVELYNTTAQEIDLTGWVLVDGSGAQTELSGRLGTAGKERFLAVENPAGYLDNQGDLIALRDNNNFLIDKVCYGQWDDGLLSDNAPAAADPLSLARRLDGYNTFNNKNDFRLTTTPTKGASNVISLNSGEHINYSDYDYSSQIVISEVFPNPTGADKTNEFIELYNAGQKAVDLSGWRLCDRAGTCFQLASQGISMPRSQYLIQPGQYLAFYRPLTKIALNNSGDEIELLAPAAIGAQQTIKYGPAPVGQSYSLFGSRWAWSKTPTPAAKNFLPAENTPPDIDFSCPATALVGQPIFFDASDTIDKNGDQLQFTWDFGDGFHNNLVCPEHTYLKAGEFTISLKVSDGQATSSLSKKIIIKTGQIKVLGLDYSASTSPTLAKAVIINEFLPNPGNQPTAEWIELKNTASQPIDLAGWQLDDSLGGSQAYQFGDQIQLAGYGFLVLPRTQTGIALNNNGDSVRLLWPNGQVAYEVSYGRAPQGWAYAFDSAQQKWQWTDQPTPGQENILPANYLLPAQTKNKLSRLKVKSSTEVPISDLLAEPEKTLVKTRGWASALPGVFSRQYFYIQDKQAGLQVYNYQGRFPDFSLGAWLEVEGTISGSGAGKRLKTSFKKIKILPLAKAVPKPRPVQAADLENLTTGQLVVVRGQVAEKEGYNIFLDDGTAEVNIYLKRRTGIKPKSLPLGAQAQVAGVLVLARAGKQIWPRQATDIVILSALAGGEPAVDQAQPLVLGVSASSSQWALAARKPPTVFKYLFIVLLAALIGFWGWRWQRKNRSSRAAKDF